MCWFLLKRAVKFELEIPKKRDLKESKIWFPTLYADFTSCDGRLLVTFQASWANIDHCMGQPYHKPAIHAMPLLFTRHEFQLLTAGNSLLHSITQRTKSPSKKIGLTIYLARFYATRGCPNLK